MPRKDPEKDRQYARKYYHSHKEECRQRGRAYHSTHKEKEWAYRQRIKLEALIHYSTNPPKCARCEETDIVVLCIDHINNDGAKHRKEHKGSANIYGWLKSNNYPEGYQVLCHNCNARKEYEYRRAQMLQS